MSDLKGMEIKDVFGFAEPVTKLIECVSCGIGKWYEPIHVKRMTKAKADEIVTISETIATNIELPSKYENGQVIIDATDFNNLIKRCGERLVFSEIRKQQNIESVIDKTYVLMEKEEYVSNESVNPDWLHTFFDEVGEISDEFMQNLWAKILTKEIKQPNTYTLRTLTTLKNITKEEAMLFNELMPFLLFADEPILYGNTELLDKYDITYDKLLVLEDCGFIKMNGMAAMKVMDDKIYNKNLVCVIKGDLHFPIYNLSECGKQIVKLLYENINFDLDYFIEVCNELKEENKGTLVKVYKINGFKDGMILHDNDNILE